MKAGKKSTRVTLNVARFVASVGTLIIMFLLVPAGQAQQPKAPKRVLVLYWYGKDFPANVEFDRSFQNVLHSAPTNIEYYPEYLETNRFPGEDQALLFRDYLRQKYADRTIDVLAASGYVPLDFLVKYRDELFP